MSGTKTSEPKRLEIYFAHTLNTYDTPLEEALRQLIAHTFRGIREIKIEDPNQPHHQEGYERFKREQPADKDGKHGGMNYFYEIVLKPMLTADAQSACVCQTFLDGKWGSGVAGEARKFILAGKPIWEIKSCKAQRTKIAVETNRKLIESFAQDPLDDLFFLRRINPWEEKRILENDPWLVVQHIETRLRTWKIYNREKRPFQEAHLAPTEVYPGFYTEDN
ncbi:MAG: hypothetical protein HYS51_02220 [Candidatus Zambryskibacteria bacterium]|nr:hypothetical protein [Candidatus Zambryskibacteria bacterium]QQG46446.1 MAG: hypothetical protein HYY55_01200 [Candidatus Niyogibacteria bacterium]